MNNDFINEIDKIADERDSQKEDALKQKKHEQEMVVLHQTIKQVGRDVAASLSKPANRTSVTVKPDTETHQLLKKLIDSVNALPKEAPEMPSMEFPGEIRVSNQVDYQNLLQEAIDAVKAIELKTEPKITVKPADVKLKVDTSKMEGSLSNIETYLSKDDTELDLTCYRVSDAAEPVTGDQYFGFVREDGGWYILHNEADEGTVRYKFGKDNYVESWPNYGSYEYKLLNEAIDEIKN